MGQNNSRGQPPLDHHTTVHDLNLPSTTQSTATTATTSLSSDNTFNNPANSVESETSFPPMRSRRSLRRSLLGLVKSPSRPSSREGSLASSSPNKRSWLNPRRWSRLPSNLLETPDEALSTSLHDGPNRSPAAINSKGKGREEPEEDDSQDLQPASPVNQQLMDTNARESATSTSGDDIIERARLPSTGSSDVGEPQVLPLPTVQQENIPQQEDPISDIAETPSLGKQDPTIPPSNETAEIVQGNLATAPADAGTSASDQLPSAFGGSSESHPTTTTPLNTTAPTRPFPPPGTLVVVQGVVHTTDVPRSNIQGTSTGTNGDSPLPEQGRTQSRWPLHQERNAVDNRRTSSILQPHSTSELRPAADANSQQPNHGNRDDVAGNDACASQGSGDVPSSSSTVGGPSRPVPTDGTGDSNAVQNVPIGSPPVESEQRSVNQSATEEVNVPGAISSSSIDVLGTLLSVAAAATAASLLTGSSEPILPTSRSPNLTNNQGNLPVVAPTSSTNSSNITSPDFSAASRAERMRNAWASIRERLGIRSSSSSDNNTPSNNNAAAAAGSAAQPTADTREMMLSEMARAFSVGLGLGGFTGPSANNNLAGRSTEAPQVPEPRPLPAEGSFERFLMDLQADLRIALTTGEGGSGVRAMVAGMGWSDANSNRSLSRHDVPVAHNVAVAGNRVNGADDVTTQQQANSNNEGVRTREATSAREGDSDGATSGEAALESSGPGPRDGRQPSEVGRINWWRLYRFPAIGVPRSNNAASAAAAAALSTGGSPSRPSSPPETESLSAAEAPVSTSPTSESTPRPSDARSTGDSGSGNDTIQENTVVPVIIVGLQSVHMDWRPGGEDVEAETNNVHNGDAPNDIDDGVNDAIGSVLEQDSNTDQGTEQSIGPSPPAVDGTQVADTDANQRRGPRWRSRAADAFRNLRPRRGGDQRNGVVNGDAAAPHLMHQMPPIGPGSRMFLIYVIGGYYPPNHSIVLGNPADLESFEALSELAELLGQVKPPTATKEDIEKSGLQVIKAILVGQYEREGKITSNCADRCLICLDDYLPEDDVRVMTCRHAFHKDCVDKWLQTGKNNCPACRSRGVSTETRGPVFS